MKEKIEDLLKRIPMPGENISIIDAQIISKIEISDEEILIEIELPQKYEKYEQALVPTIEDVVKRSLSFTGKISIPVSILKANHSKEPGGISKVKNIIAVASGKGGVGKSTISSNLAIALSQLGYKVGLLDADIFGPSVPKMFGLEGFQPAMKKIGDKDFIEPVEKYGIRVLSIGFFVKAGDAVIWRGPMAGNVLKQLILDTDWGELDFLLLDMPPGTSDIQLTISQTIELTGAVMVSTPQDIALIDVIKGIDFFRKEKIAVPILGLVENMAWFTPTELPNNKYYIFGKGGAEKLSKDLSIPFLGAVPIVQSIREGGDAGMPISAKENSILGVQFKEIANRIVESIK